jgi:hypothetical protein
MVWSWSVFVLNLSPVGTLHGSHPLSLFCRHRVARDNRKRHPQNLPASLVLHLLAGTVALLLVVASMIQRFAGERLREFWTVCDEVGLADPTPSSAYVLAEYPENPRFAFLIDLFAARPLACLLAVPDGYFGG